MDIRRLCVFCGSSEGNDPVYKAAAQSMGKMLVRRGVGLVYGGGSIGLMGVLADAVLAGGGEVTGVIPSALATKEVQHTGLTHTRVVDNMHARKALMNQLSDGFVAMPGGYGTLEELFEVVTWAQLGLHAKPVGLLNVVGYFDGLLG
ncbi:MAG TPA: TIGR00730 family Rossman fold protein, partial [Planctomycetota bacterium]|nr:TIGR00730 family Rossman fold protein [Planctomycetota bacterium]